MLSSINTGGPLPSFAAVTPAAKPAATNQPQDPKSPNSITTSRGIISQPPKRKADGDLDDGTGKSQRKDQPGSVASASSSVHSGDNDNGQAAAKPATPYRGTARPTKTLVAGAPVATPSAAPPKKGSYQEILLRAKAAQEARPAAGTIKHKPMEKTSRLRRGRAGLAGAAKSIRDKAKDKNGSLATKSNGAEMPKPQPTDLSKHKRKPIDLGYKGTARPASGQSTYKGTMNLAAPARAPGRVSGVNTARGRIEKTPISSPAKGQKVRLAGYASYSEHESEDNYESDASSDMEAAAFDLQEEEEMSLRAAKKEDDAALAEENELKRQKAERKKKLAEMAAKAGAKKRY